MPHQTKQWKPTRPAHLSDPASFDPESRVLMVDFRSGEAVIRHPQLRVLIEGGWSVESAVPYCEDADDVKLLVVLRRKAGDEYLTAD